MSDEVLAPILTVAVLIALVLWVPTLHLCNARCRQLLRGRAKRDQGTAQLSTTQDQSTA